MRTKSFICRGRVRIIEDAVDLWKTDHDDAMAVRDIEALARECSCVLELLREWQEESWQRLLNDQLGDVQQTGELLKAVFRGAIEVFPRVAHLIQWAGGKGYRVDGSEEFAGALSEIRRLNLELEQRWPFVSCEEKEEARAQIRLGECQTGEDILRELQGSNTAGD